MARDAVPVASSTTTHWAGPPWPVRADSKSAGIVPTVVLSMGIMIAPACAPRAGWAQASAPVAAMAINVARMIGSRWSLPSMRKRLDTSSVAQSLDGQPSGGESAMPPDYANLMLLISPSQAQRVFSRELDLSISPTLQRHEAAAEPQARGPTQK